MGLNYNIRITVRFKKHSFCNLKTIPQAIARVGSIAFLLHPDVYEANGDRILLTLATQLNTRRNIPVLPDALGFSSWLSSEHF